MTDWCILRTSGRSTLRLAASLERDGYEVWTPTERKTFRSPRRNARRTVTVPMLAGYVFARASKALDLIQLSHDLTEGLRPGHVNHPNFRVWLLGRGAWSIADREMEGLRQQERDARTAAALASRRNKWEKTTPLPPGVRVRVKHGEAAAGIFSGLVGRVIQSNSSSSTILFNGATREWTIKTSLLSLDDVGQTSSLNGDAAQDAER